jgi:hypothetical protein
MHAQHNLIRGETRSELGKKTCLTQLQKFD